VPTVVELSDPYANFLLPPAPPGTAGVCSVCLTFTQGFDTCYPCGHRRRALDAVLPISYSPRLGQLHAALRGYKEGWASSRRFTIELAAVLWRFLARHESCLARRTGVDRFPIVTTVPSSDVERDTAHPLHEIVGRLVGHTAGRFERLLAPSGADVEKRTVDAGRYQAMRELDSESVLLIDDTWTTGASAESAAQVLKVVGARAVSAVVIGRHIRPNHEDNAERLRTLPPFAWDVCAFE
jgi:predicted amidophosphoribosyltransferase